MKRIIATILMICLISATFSTIVFANGGDIEISSVTYVSSGTRFNITINGMADDGENVSVQVRNSIGTVRGLKQFKVKGADTFSYTVVIDTAADNSLTEADGALNYTIMVRSSDNSSDTYLLPLYTEASKLDIIGKFNGTDDVDVMKGYIDIYQKVFGFNVKYYAGKESSVAYFMTKTKIPFTLGNIVDLYNESVIRAYLFDADFNADRTVIIEYPDYASVLGFDTGFDNAKSLYKDYKDMNGASKAKVNEIAFVNTNEEDDFTTLKEKFFMAIVSVMFADKKDDEKDIYTFLKDHNDWLKLEKLEKLSTYDAYQIILEMAKKDIADNKADFVKLYDEVRATVCKEEGSKTPSTGGGGGASGGGGGGGASGITTNKPAEEIGYEKPEVTEQIKPVEVKSFNDLANYSWAKEAIEVLASKGVVNGKAEGVFAPADNITREEFAKILTLAYGLDTVKAECDFSDMDKDRWSYKYVAAMYEMGAISGYPDGTFKPDSFVTREEMAVMLCRVLLKLSKIEIDYAQSSSYNDYEEVSEFAQNSVRTLSNHKILSGDDNGCFNPKKGATRAEVCKMIYNTGL